MFNSQTFNYPGSIPKYRFNEENLKFINDDLRSADWASVFNTGDLETDWYNFTNIIFTSVNKFADKITPGPSRPRRSYPSAVNKLLSKKRTLWKAYKTFNTDPLKKKYLECARMCRLAIIKHIADMENNIVSSNKVGNFYKYANKKLSCRSGIGVIRNSDGCVISDPVDQANCFNDFFASVFVKDNDVTPHIDSRVPDHVSLNNITFSRTDVFKILKGLNARSAGGPDHIPPILLKNIASSIAQPLATIFELFYQNSFLPHIWKQSYVKPIFKSNDSSSVSNYRPISLTCTCCKVMESVIHDQLMSYLSQHKLISTAQHGFLTKKSTGTNLLSCLHDWQLSLKNKKLIDIVYLDFKKAFDSLVHSKIITKLSAYGIEHELLAWIHAFLTGRSQRVIVENALSKPIDVGSGVVQGSVLGPLIFILFINDIVECLDADEVNHTSCCIFADDLKLYSSYVATDDSSPMSKTIKNIEIWANQWQLSINPDKSLVMHVGSKLPARYNYSVCSVIIKPSVLIRDLGITYDCNLRFTDYIDGIVKKAFMRTNLLFRAFVSGNVHILTRAYLTYIRPIVEYCTYIWSPHQAYLIDKIERIQRYFTRRVLCRTKLSYMERLSLLKLDLLEIRRIKSDLKMCFKIINGLCDIDPLHYFKFAPTLSVTRGHNIRLIKPICNTNCQLYFFTNRVVNYWNSLPADIVNASSFGIFVRKLDSHDLSGFCRGGRA